MLLRVRRGNIMSEINIKLKSLSLKGFKMEAGLWSGIRGKASYTVVRIY